MRAMAPTVLIGWFAAVFALYLSWVSTLLLVGVHHDPAIHGGEHAILLAVFEITAAFVPLVERALDRQRIG